MRTRKTFRSGVKETKPQPKEDATPSLRPDPKLIARVAYGLWEEAGRPPERDVEFWLAAEEKLAQDGSSEKREGGGPTRTPATKRSGTAARLMADPLPQMAAAASVAPFLFRWFD